MTKHIILLMLLSFLLCSCGDGLMFEIHENQVVEIKEFRVKQGDKWEDIEGMFTIQQYSTAAIEVSFVDPEIDHVQYPDEYEYEWSVVLLELTQGADVGQPPPETIMPDFLVKDDNPCILRAANEGRAASAGIYRIIIAIVDYHGEAAEGSTIAEIVAP